MLKYLVFPFFILLASCATPIKQAHYKNSYIERSFPGVSVFFEKPPYGSYSRDSIVLNELRKQNLFKEIYFNHPGPELRIDAKYVKSVRENEIWYNAKFFMSIFTLMIIPAQLEYEYNLDFTISYNGRALKKYTYYRESDENMSIFNDRYEGDYIVVESMVSEFTKDILKDKSMYVIKMDNNIINNADNSI